MIHFYYGGGKGKTSAAVGACVRAVGCGMSCVFVQFFKNGTSGEIQPLRTMGVQVLACSFAGRRFFRDMSPAEQAAVIAEHNENLRAVLQTEAQMIVLDEFGDALAKKAVDPELVRQMLAKKDCELILTGHRPSDMLSAAADYVTEFRCVAHPYQSGIPARRGVEY